MLSLSKLLLLFLERLKRVTSSKIIEDILLKYYAIGIFKKRYLKLQMFQYLFMFNVSYIYELKPAQTIFANRFEL